MAAVRPLRRWKTLDVDEHGHSDPTLPVVVRYGDQSYLTNDMRFYVYAQGGEWYVTHNAQIGLPTVAAVTDTGLFATGFPRRRDAVEALETVLGEIE